MVCIFETYLHKTIFIKQGNVESNSSINKVNTKSIQKSVKLRPFNTLTNESHLQAGSQSYGKTV